MIDRGDSPARFATDGGGPAAPCTRRVALAVIAAGAVGCGAGAPVVAVAPAEGRVRLGLDQFPALATTGGHAVVEIEGERWIVVRVSDAEATAVSATCTHQGCLVSWKAEAVEHRCPCHGSRFSAAGAVIEGPAERPLPTRAATIEPGAVFVVAGKVPA